ncbi:MAG TPA: Stf0 family sulfotransferase [Solirubrobacterales bacterium]|nr:Stf0 family sulfotransferase [Solirubrobacterales bacterium]
MPRLFVILCLGRSGSTLLAELLGSCPEIWMEGEILAGRSDSSWQAQTSRLARFLASARASGSQAAGFKAKLTDVLAPEDFRLLLREEGFHLVLLTRRDVVKQALSWIYADRLFERYGVWNVTRDGIDFEPLAVDGAELVRRIKILERGREALLRFVDTCGLSITRVGYEVLQESPPAEAGRVARALGVTPSLGLESRLRKHTPDRLIDAVANPAEVLAHLAAAGYL